MSASDDFALFGQHVDALFVHDANGRIVRANEPVFSPAPRFYFGRTAGGNTWRFRFDLPDEVVDELEQLAAAEPIAAAFPAPLANLDGFRAVLGRHGALTSSYHGPAYRFPSEIPRPANVAFLDAANVHLIDAMGQGWEDFAVELPDRQPCVVMVEDGGVVAICFCSRRTTRVAEAGIETHPAFRGRGYATTVAAGWARAVRERGLEPLYGTSWDNRASQGVARRLNLTVYGEDLSIP